MKTVRRAWSLQRQAGSSMATLVRKLNHVAQVLKRWGANKVLQGKMAKDKILQQLASFGCLEEAGLLNDSDRLCRNTLKTEFKKIFLREEIYWKQRSKKKWIKVGDRNTQYFQMIASERRRINYIAFIKVGEQTFHKRRTS